MDSNALPNERLIAYLLGDLSAADASLVEASVRADATTAARLEQVKRLVGELRIDDGREPPLGLVSKVKSMMTAPVRASWLAGLREVLASLVFDSTAQTAVAGFRGTSSATHFTYAAGEVEIDVRVSPPAPGSERFGLLGQIDSPGSSPSRAALLDDEGLAVATAEVDGRGLFRLDAPKGVYDLCVASGDSAIKLPRFRVE